MTLRRRVARLETRLPPPPSQETLHRLAIWAPIFERWDFLSAAAFELMCPDEQDRVLRAVRQLHETCQGPYGNWFCTLCEGGCRLPELAPPVMKDLLLAWLSPAVASGYVCEGCGLMYPFRHWQRTAPRPWADAPQGFVPDSLPGFFKACPHCGRPRSDQGWPGGVEHPEPAWKDLDGCVGNRIVGDVT